MIDFIDESLAHLEKFKNEFNQEELVELVKDIHEHDSVIFMGLYQASCISNSLQKDLLSFNKVVANVGDIFKQRSIIERATSDDLIVVFSATASFFDSVLLRKNVMNRKNLPKIYVITVNDSLEEKFVHKYIRLSDSYNFASCMLLNFYSTAIAIEYKTKYFVS